MSNPLRHVGQTARPEEGPKPPDAAEVQPGDEAGSTLEQHPRTTDTPAPPGQPAAPRGARKEIKDLEPGEPPPESSAGS